MPVRQNQYLDRSLGQSGKIRFYSRQGDQSERDLIDRVDVTTKKIEP